MDRLEGSLGMAEPAAQRIVVRKQPVDLGRERFQIREIHDPHRPASDLVFIGRSDAPAGRADFRAGIRSRVFAKSVELPVQRQDKRCVFGNFQAVRGDVHALRLELGDFRDEGMRVEHHAVADDRQLAVAHDAGGQQRQLVDLAVDHQRVAGIVAALEAHHDVGPLGQPVDDLALALVAPLRADDHHIGHSISLSCGPGETAGPAKLTGLYRRDPESWQRFSLRRARIARIVANRQCPAEAQRISGFRTIYLSGPRNRSGEPARSSEPRLMHRTSLCPAAADDPVLGRQCDRRQAGGRPYLADAADRRALGASRS